MLRLFAGLQIPELHRARLGLIRAPLAGAKWVEPENMHVTLRFAGDIDNRTAADFADLLAAIEVEPFEIRIADLGVFGGREPRIIWAGVEGGEALAMLHRATERAARAAGLAPDTQTFKPHVTLARLRGARPEAVASLLGSLPRLELPSYQVHEFALFSSRPKVGGGPYVIEETYALGD